MSGQVYLSGFWHGECTGIRSAQSRAVCSVRELMLKSPPLHPFPQCTRPCRPYSTLYCSEVSRLSSPSTCTSKALAHPSWLNWHNSSFRGLRPLKIPLGSSVSAEEIDSKENVKQVSTRQISTTPEMLVGIPPFHCFS